MTCYPRLHPTWAATWQVTRSEFTGLPCATEKFIHSLGCSGAQRGYRRVRDHVEVQSVCLGFTTNLLLKGDKVTVTTTTYRALAIYGVLF